MVDKDRLGSVYMNKELENILPVILGTDLNTYGVARAFHEQYNIKSIAFGQAELIMVKHSKIVDTHVIENFSDDQIFIDSLIKFAKENPDKKLILLAASENYVMRIFKFYDKLKDFYFIPYVRPELGIKLSDKMNFYNLCEKYDIPYPRAELLNKDNYRGFDTDISYPLILKAQESSDYFNLSFDGKEKAYIIGDKKDLINTLDKIYEAGYEHSMIVQDLVQGPVTNEIVVNVYLDKNSHLKLISAGQIILDDPNPLMRGNYVAIGQIKDKAKLEAILERVEKFLKDEKYTGLANFDFKLDDKDGQIKAFEVNLRQGRSSYFSILAGANFARAIVNDLLNIEEELIQGNNDFLWLNTRQEDFYKYMEKNCPESLERFKSISKIGKTLDYDFDKSFSRNRLVKKFYKGYGESLNK